MASSMQKVNLTQHFLIAMPAMADPHFAKSLTFVCEHNDQGALGVVVNRPTEMNLHALLEQVSIATASEMFKSVSVHFGGPVQVDRGFVLHTPLGDWQSTLAVSPDIGLTTSKDILEAVARGEGPRQMLVTLGYAGWAPGQLEHELAQNAWLTVQAKPEVIFDLPPEERLTAAMSLLGVDYAKLSEVAGHS
ncbi:MAG TPA: YqgE/AlgH family protein [Burkholderiales bacterium]|jgi:putative transcriptional regulator|nr:YqgE/AlgH family protein [Burkholderiales bacterium]